MKIDDKERKQGEARLKRSGPKEEDIVELWPTMKDRYDKAAASYLSIICVVG